MHIQAGQCGNQIGAKVRPRAASTRRTLHPARLPRPHPSRPPGSEAGRRRALEPRSPPRRREQSPGPTLPPPPPPFSCPRGSPGPPERRASPQRRAFRSCALLPWLRPRSWGAGWAWPSLGSQLSRGQVRVGLRPQSHNNSLRAPSRASWPHPVPLLGEGWNRDSADLGLGLDCPSAQPLLAWPVPLPPPRVASDMGQSWALGGPSPPSFAHLTDVRTEAGRGGGMYPRSSVTSPSVRRPALAQGHTTSPCGHARGAQVEWVRRCGPRLLRATRGMRQLCQDQGQGPGAGLWWSWSLNRARRQGLEGKGPSKASSGGCCCGNQRRTKS